MLWRFAQIARTVTRGTLGVRSAPEDCARVLRRTWGTNESAGQRGGVDSAASRSRIPDAVGGRGFVSTRGPGCANSVVVAGFHSDGQRRTHRSYLRLDLCSGPGRRPIAVWPRRPVPQACGVDHNRSCPRCAGRHDGDPECRSASVVGMRRPSQRGQWPVQGGAECLAPRGPGGSAVPGRNRCPPSDSADGAVGWVRRRRRATGFRWA